MTDVSAWNKTFGQGKGQEMAKEGLLRHYKNENSQERKNVVADMKNNVKVDMAEKDKNVVLDKAHVQKSLFERGMTFLGKIWR